MRVAAAAVSGLVLALAGPPFDFTIGVWLGLAGFAFVLGSARARFADALAVGTAFGFGANMLAVRFVPAVVARFTPLPYAAGVFALVLLAVGQGLAWGAGALAYEALARRRIPRAFAFATGIYVASFAPAVFPATAAGLASAWPVMVQLADVVGERGVAFVLALTAGLVAEAAIELVASRDRTQVRRALLPLVIAAALTVGVVLEGTSRIRAFAREGTTDTVRVALIAPAVPAEARWDPSRAEGVLELLTTLTREAEAQGAELTVWHETAYPYVVAASSRRCPMGEHAMLGAGVHGPVLAGAVFSAGPGDAYNAAAVCASKPVWGDILGAPYAKRRLLAFGEAVPFAEHAPWLRHVFARGLGLVPGDRNVILTAGAVRASALICFEDTLTGAGHDAMAGSPNLLVNITNDAWFEGSAETELHLRLSAMRAVETRRDFVRAVNVGPAAWIDATGRVRARSSGAPGDAPSFLMVTPTLRETPATLFARFGDTPTATGLLLALAAIGGANTLNARRRARPLD